MHRPEPKALRVLLAFAGLCLLALPLRADDELLRDFKRLFRQFKLSSDRTEAVLALAGCESPGVVEALLPILADEDPSVVDAGVRVLAGLRTPEPVAALFAALEAEKKEERRLGLLRAVAEGGLPGPVDPLLKAAADRSWKLRWRAAACLAQRSEEVAKKALLVACSDKEPAVRSAGLEGLARMRAKEVVEPAIQALADPVWQVRVSAARALGLVRDQRSIAPLIARMELEEGRLLVDYGEALERLTGRLLGPRADLWRQFWDGVGERYTLPTDEELALLAARRAEARARYERPGAVAYHGVDTPSRSIVFVVDVSGSMEAHVVEKERFKDGNYPSMARMDIVKTELARTIEKLEPFVRFNVISFATDVDSWRKDLAPANPLNKRAAADWVRKLQPIGGNSKEDLAQVGLVQSANLEGGRTNTYGALMRAFGVDPRKGIEQGYQSEVDTIFFLSDGRPTVGDLIDPDDILAAVARVNDLRKVVLHTIAIGEFRKDFMRKLAEEHGGQFIDLGQ
jgi:HEAT repeat protein